MSIPKGNCPQCGRSTRLDPAKNPYRPFCSERCRLIDLGAWFDGSNRLPSEEPADFDDFQDDDVTRH